MAGTAAQPAPECARARTPIEKAICADPALAAADAQMAKAYAVLRAGLPADQQAALLSDQRSWIRRRDAACSEADATELVACLARETEARRRFLTGMGPDDAAEAPRLLPAFFREAKTGRYEIDAAYPRLSGAGAVDEVFNKAVRTLVRAGKVLEEYRKSEPNPNGAPNSYAVSYETRFLSQRLAVVVFTFSTYTGGAHPNTTSSSLLFDLARGRALRLDDVLAAPKEAVPALAVPCKQQLEKEASEGGWELFPEADPADSVGDIKSWAPDKAGVDILFDPYAVAAYATGPHQCRFAYAELRRWLVPDGPLPPR
jgi:uncharacterized protein YecT (DUF1311 family)